MVPPPPQNQPQQQQQQTISKPIVQKPEQNKNIHVFITGILNIYCGVFTIETKINYTLMALVQHQINLKMIFINLSINKFGRFNRPLN